MPKRKFIFIIRYKKYGDSYLIHTGGPINNKAYWSIAPYKTLESNKKYFAKNNDGFTNKWIKVD